MEEDKVEVKEELSPLAEYDTLVLSGGGAKGFVLLGAVQAATDSNLLNNITTYIGTSIGAVISYLLAIGYTPIELMVAIHMNKWLEKMQHFNLVAMINGNGATSFTNMQEGLEKMTTDKIGRYITLRQLKDEYNKTLVCTTYNMTTSKTEYLGPENYPDLPCITAIKMSANIPLVFDRFKYMDNFYIDGGISDNFPILKGEEVGKKILGINISIKERALADNPDDGVLSYIFKLLQVPINQSTEHRSSLASDKCTIVSVSTTNLRTALEFNVCSKTRLEMFSAGYSQFKDFLENGNK
jgi:NTE family protein